MKVENVVEKKLERQIFSVVCSINLLGLKWSKNCIFITANNLQSFNFCLISSLNKRSTALTIFTQQTS